MDVTVMALQYRLAVDSSKGVPLVTMTMTMTHSERSRIHRMKAWPYRQECRDHGPTKKNLFYW